MRKLFGSNAPALYNFGATRADMEELLKILKDCSHDLWEDWEKNGGPRSDKYEVRRLIQHIEDLLALT